MPGDFELTNVGPFVGGRQALDRLRDGGLPTMIGNTPLVHFVHLLGRYEFRFFGKMEMLNPGGSIKDRTAVSIMEKAIRDGAIHEGSTVVESSSGNMDVALPSSAVTIA